MAQKSLLPIDEINALTKLVSYSTSEINHPEKLTKDECVDALLDILIMAYMYGVDTANADLGSNVKISESELFGSIYKIVDGKTFEQRVTEYFVATNSVDNQNINGVVPNAIKTSQSVNVSPLNKPNATSTPSKLSHADVANAQGSSNEKNTPNGISLPDAIKRIADTESHRVFNEAIVTTATKFKKIAPKGTQIYKTWQTMLDDRVRDTHDYLESETIEFEKEFYTYDGDHAMSPGGFKDASNNINCRCYIKLST